MNFDAFKKLTKKQRVKILFGVAGFFGAACLFIILMNFRGITVEAPNQMIEDEQPAVISRDPFTGEALQGEFEGSRVACVMVENSSDAWPLSGVEDAFLVIEAPVEGGIPRFMACYEEGSEVEKIGPVRSARSYYVSWASGFGAMYAHVGGSPAALEDLAVSTYVTDLNEFWNGSSFWRDSVRLAPHNVYTSTALLWAAADHLEVPLAQSAAWLYEASSYEKGKQPCDDIVIRWNSASVYDPTWLCDEETGAYKRFQGTGEARSSDNNKYIAANVVIIESDITIVDEVTRRHIVTEGTGNARVCSQGFCHDAIWHKEGVDKPLQFFTAYPNEPFIFAPGKTWIEVVGNIDGVTAGEEILKATE
jgi:hypothetical protein